MGKLEREAKQETAGILEGGEGDLDGGGLADWGAFGMLVLVFVLFDVFRQLFSLLLILLPLRQYHAERLCNLWMQLAWKVTLKNDESSKGSEP
jgi:hypothetical protein